MKPIKILILAFLLASCSQEEIVVKETATGTQNELRSLTEAKEIACEYANEVFNTSRSSHEITSVPVVLTSTGKSRTNSDTLLYVVNFDENSGFAIIPADKNSVPVVAITEEGHYDLTSGSGVPPMDGFIDITKQIIEDGKLNDVTINIPKANIPSEAHVKVQWGQDWPEGLYCPNKCCGCVATAAAQLLTAFKPDCYFEYTFPEKDKDGEYINWTRLINHTRSINNPEPYPIEVNNHICSTNDASHKTIGRLCREIGLKAHASYETDPRKTGAFLSTAAITISKWIGKDYEYVYSDFWLHLKNDGVALASGLSSVGRHAWLVDGLKTVVIINEGFDPNEALPLLHINWGWCGLNNGWFLSGIFDIGNAYEFDDPTLVINGNYDFGTGNQMYVFHL